HAIGVPEDDDAQPAAWYRGIVRDDMDRVQRPIAGIGLIRVAIAIGSFEVKRGKSGLGHGGMVLVVWRVESWPRSTIAGGWRSPWSDRVSLGEGVNAPLVEFARFAVEGGRRNVSVDALECIAAALGVRGSLLLAEAEDSDK